MPIHDWTHVDAGLFHAFHHDWITILSRALNAGVLPGDYYALPEQSVQGPVPDVLTLKVEYAAVGEPLPDMPIFLKPGLYVLAPLESSYQTTWHDFFPAPLKGLLEAPAQKLGAN